MARLTNPTRRYQLLIDGVDYSTKMISWQVSDSSANKNGIIQTQGEVILGEIVGGNSLEDYDRNLFKRGATVILNVYKPGAGSPTRHPRGYLYVITTGYSPESSSLSVKIGCKLTLAAITDDPSSVVSLVPIPLEEDRQDLSNCAASFAAAGKVLYQDNQGNLVSRTFFGGDGYSTAASGLWTAVMGQTTIGVSPMLGGNALPDILELSYSVPDQGLGPNETDYEKIETDSFYPTKYPGFAFERINGTTGIGDSNVTTTTPSTSSCGNAPGTPAEALGLPSCTEGFYTAQYTPMVDVKSRETNETWYLGPAGQVSRTVSTQRGPGVEVNSQYYADRYAYCKYTYASACNPTGSCPFYGATTEDTFIIKGYTVVENTYGGEANELIKTVTDEYVNILSLAKEDDWRSGIENGIPQDYRTISADPLIHSKRLIEKFTQSTGSVTIKEEISYESPPDSGISIGEANLNCLGPYGVKTKKKFITTKTTGKPIAPDIVKTPEVSTKEESIELPVFTSTYTGPSEAGPYKIKESMPIPLLVEGTIDSYVNTYADYLVRFIKGDAYGVNVTETLRNAVIDSWYPGMPFYLSDPEKGKILSLRMDATVWGVSGEEALMVTNGIWIGDSLGTLVAAGNVTGNTTPVIPEETVPPIPPVIPQEPTVTGGENVYNGPLSFPVITIETGTEIEMTFPGLNGVLSLIDDVESDLNFTTVLSVLGFSLQPGNLLTLEMDGKLPVAANGSLITGNPTVIDPDLFAA
jgi:hypothetical protein